MDVKITFMSACACALLGREITDGFQNLKLSTVAKELDEIYHTKFKTGSSSVSLFQHSPKGFGLMLTQAFKKALTLF